MRALLCSLTFLLVACAGAEQRPTASSFPPHTDAAEAHYWPAGPRLERPVVRSGRVEAYTQSAPALAEAEAAYQQQRWDDAKAAYLRAAEQCPTCYLALTGWADVELSRKGGDVPASLRRYEQALELNPDDAQLHAFRASALFRLGKGLEGVRELSEALVLRPRYPFALVLADRARTGLHLPLQLDAEPLSPTGWLVPKGDGKSGKLEMQYRYAGGGPNTLDDLPWIVYGSCKWLGPNKEYKGDPSPVHPWDAGVEAGCLAKVAEGYKAQSAGMAKIEKEKGVRLLQHSNGLNRLAKAVDAGFLAEFVRYEIQSRMEPQVTLTLQPAERERLRLYVERFVLGVSAAP